MLDAFIDILDTFGQVAKITFADASTRDIKALVNFKANANLGPRGTGPLTEVLVANDATLGIANSELTERKDTITMTAKDGSEQTRLIIKRLIVTDTTLRLEVR